MATERREVVVTGAELHPFSSQAHWMVTLEAPRISKQPLQSAWPHSREVRLETASKEMTMIHDISIIISYQY